MRAPTNKFGECITSASDRCVWLGCQPGNREGASTEGGTKQPRNLFVCRKGTRTSANAAHGGVFESCAFIPPPRWHKNTSRAGCNSDAAERWSRKKRRPQAQLRAYDIHVNPTTALRQSRTRGGRRRRCHHGKTAPCPATSRCAPLRPRGRPLGWGIRDPWGWALRSFRTPAGRRPWGPRPCQPGWTSRSTWSGRGRALAGGSDQTRRWEWRRARANRSVERWGGLDYSRVIVLGGDRSTRAQREGRCCARSPSRSTVIGCTTIHTRAGLSLRLTYSDTSTLFVLSDCFPLLLVVGADALDVVYREEQAQRGTF